MQLEESLYNALVVDDESSLRQLLARVLTRTGFRCDLAEDGYAALKLIERRQYDLVVTDLKMPQLNGHALCTCIMSSKSETKPLICVLTGVIEPRIEKDLRRRGVEHIYFKPVDFKDFAEQMLQIVRAERPLQDLPGQPPRSNQARHRIALLSTDLSLGGRMLLVSGQHEVDIEVCVSTDHLLEIVQGRRIDLLLIDQHLSGFLKGDQIIARLHDDLINIPGFLRVPTEEFDRYDINKMEGVERILRDTDTPGDMLQQAADFLHRLSYHRLMIEPAARRLVTESNDVPPLPHVLTRLANHLGQPAEKLSIPEIVADIESDSRLTSELIKVSNSSMVSSCTRHSDLKSVVVLLGARRAISICLALGLRTVRSQLMKSWAEEFRAWYLKRSTIIAAMAEAYAKHYEKVPPETAFLMGVLQDIGIMVLAEHYGQAYYERVVERVREIPTLHLTTSERFVTNTDHGMVSAAVLQSWGFPFSIVQPVFAHHLESEDSELTKMGAGLVRCMRVAEAFAEVCENPAPQRVMKLNELLSRYSKTSREEARPVFLEAIEKAKHATEILNTPPLDGSELESLVNQLNLQDESPLELPNLNEEVAPTSMMQ